MKRVLVLGCTGSIGSQTLDLCRSMKDDFSVVGLSAGSREQELNELCKEFNCPGTLFSRDGIDGIKNLVKNCGADIAVNGIAGASGLEPSVLVLEQGIDLALANKESVVMAWPIIKRLAAENNASIIPVDSEHSAIFNLTQKFSPNDLSELVITASGGPFRNYSDEQLKTVSVADALKHPTWNMGTKITIDSASLANKGLEVIEACRLFDFPTEKIKVVVHPQSLIHSLVRTKDGMLYAQISNPDMRHPIYGALVWPEYKEVPLEPFSLFDTEMTFYRPRTESFPMLNIAFDCAKKGNSYTIAYNAANEIAVDAFIKEKISFVDIPVIVGKTVAGDWSIVPDTLEIVYQQDKLARNAALSILDEMAGGSI